MSAYSEAVDRFHFIYEPMRIAFGLRYRARFTHGEYLIEVYQLKEPKSEMKKIIKVEAEDQQEAWEQATRELIRYHNIINRRKSNEGS